MTIESKAPRRNKRDLWPREVFVRVMRAASMAIPTINSGMDNIL